MSETAQAPIIARDPHELIVSFLERECSVKRDDYDNLYVRMIQWGNAQAAKACVNEFSPIMLLEQVRREFDETVDFVQFALVAADLQWGPRMIQLGGYDKPVWVCALQGFPHAIAEAHRAIARQAAEQVPSKVKVPDERV